MTLDCEKCHKNFSTETDLYKHLLTHQEELDEPTESKKRHKRKSITCKECDKVFHKKSDFQSHMSKHRIGHQENDVPKNEENAVPQRRRGRPYARITSTCQDCKEVFYRRCDLRLHRRMEHRSKKNTCSVCKRSFSNEKRFKMHYQFHNVGGAYQCVYCDKSFNKGWKLKIHLVNHNGKSPYLCQLCGEDFLYPGKIIDHLKREHDLYFSCQDCGTGFRTFLEQDFHICLLYACRDCNKAFSTREGLVSHIETHSTPTSSVKQEPTLDVTTGLVPSLYTAHDTLNASHSQDNQVSSNGLDSESSQKTPDTPPDVKHEEDAVKFVVRNADLSSVTSTNKKSVPISPRANNDSKNNEGEIPGDSGLVIKNENDSSSSLEPDKDAGVNAESTNIAIVKASKSSAAMNKTNGKVKSRRKSSIVSAPHNMSLPEKKLQKLETEDTKNFDLGSWEFTINRDTVVKPRPLSLKTWLTSDNLPCVTNDFVFGRGHESDASEITMRPEIKVEKDDYPMSFEALC